MNTALKLHAWAIRNGVDSRALSELNAILGEVANIAGYADPESVAKTEGGALNEIRHEAATKGHWLMRNNSGAGIIEGRQVRWGLGNISKKVNKKCKSADLIGIRTVIITREMVGSRFGQFLAREVKKPGWKYRGTAEERAQLHFINLVNTAGGDAAFATGRGMI